MKWAAIIILVSFVYFRYFHKTPKSSSERLYKDFIDKGITPLHLAVLLNPPIDIIIAFINQGFDINAKDYKGNTPLHYSLTYQSSPHTVCSLVSLHACMSIKNNENLSPREMIENNPDLEYYKSSVLAANLIHQNPFNDNKFSFQNIPDDNNLDPFTIFDAKTLNLLAQIISGNKSDNAFPNNDFDQPQSTSSKFTIKHILSEITLLEDQFHDKLGYHEVKEMAVQYIKSNKNEIEKTMNVQNISPKIAAYSFVNNVSGDLLETGKYHIYRGTLSETGQDILMIFNNTADELVRLGDCTKDYSERQKQNILSSISICG